MSMRKKGKWLVSIVILTVVILAVSVTVVVRVNNRPLPASEKDVSEFVAQQESVLTDRFHQNKAILDTLVLRTIAGPDYRVCRPDYSVDSYLRANNPPGINRYPHDYIPAELTDLAMKLANAGMSSACIEKQGRTMVMEAFDLQDNLSNSSSRVTSRGFPDFIDIYYVYSNVRDYSDLPICDQRITDLEDSWILCTGIHYGI